MANLLGRLTPFLAAVTLIGLLVADLCGAGADPSVRPLPPGDAIDRGIAALAEADARTVTFDDIASFPCPWPEAGTVVDWRKDVPADVLALDGQRVALAGWSIPLALDADRVTQFLLSKHPPECCFGLLPQANEMVTVELEPGGSIPYEPFNAVVVVGTLQISDPAAGGGQMSGIYTLKDARAQTVPTSQ
jgi:hypothetical protein